jgi:hypothetical protein
MPKSSTCGCAKKNPKTEAMQSYFIFHIPDKIQVFRKIPSKNISYYWQKDQDKN